MKSLKSEELTIAASQSFKEREYWLKKLSGELLKSSFPYEFTSSDMNARRLNTQKFEFSGDILSKLIKLSNESDRRLYMILLAGFVVLLYKYTGNRDIIVGMPVEKQEIEGEFINTVLTVRNQLKENTTFKELLLQVRKTVIEAIENQNYPVETILYDLGLDFNENEFPLFDAAVLLENIHDKRYIQHIPVNMTFVFSRTNDRIEGYVEYNSVLYEKTGIERVIRQLKKSLSESLYDINIEVDHVDILSEEERRQLLFDFNNREEFPGPAGTIYPDDKTIHGLFENEVEKNPDNIAVKYEEVQLSYKKFNKIANHQAHTLRAKAVKPNTIVGIMMERSIEMISAMLGILKSGGVYLPIDPAYPEERIKYMIKDSEVELILSENDRVPEMGETFEGKLIPMDSKNSDPGECSNPGTGHHINNSAYVIYTSGSTGKPKGVIIEHKSIVNTLSWRKNYYKFDQRDVVLQVPSYSFDSSVEDIFTPLISGSKLVLLQKENPFAIEYLGKTISKNSVTHFLIVPNFYKTFLEEIPGSLKDLRKITVAGDHFTEELVKKHFERLTHVKLYNEYGPTENSVCTTVYEFSPDRTGVLIGTPITNVNCFILDKNQHLNPIGVPGELYISGAGITRGYLDRPGLTSEKFISNPLEPGHRMYQTGDLARWSGDGNLVFLGRVDNQVKLRGFRIELGEIESKLSHHHEIKEAVVVARENEYGDKYLCAYVVLNSELPVAKIRDYLLQELPDYMIPSHFVNLESIPLNTHGKVDRNALPDPEGSRLEDDVEYVFPRNEVEKTLVEIWEKVLGRNNIGINENFFMIGGDSIRSIQIISRLNTEGYKLDMGDLFQYPIISDLAPHIKKLERIPDQSTVTGTIPLTPIQERFFLNSQLDHHYFNQAVMLHSARGFDEEMVKSMFTKIQEHHDALRMTYKRKTENGNVVQTNHGTDYPLSLEIYDFKNKGKANAPEAIENEANKIQASIDLENGPLMKLGLFHMDDGDRLLIVFHHLVADGVSWRILFEDIETLMQQFKNGEPLELPLKTDSFKLWAERLSGYADSAAFLKEKNYWAELESAAVPRIKKDFDGEDNYIKDTTMLSFHLNKEETARLLTTVNEAFGTEINDILMTALGLGVKKTWGYDRLLVSLEGHGRGDIMEEIDISRTIGWFTSSYPFLLDISYESDLGRQVKEIKETLRKVPNKGVGYEILRYVTSKNHKEDINFQLKPQVGFNYLGQFDVDVEKRSFEIANESVGSMQSIDGQNEFELEVNGLVANNRLEMNIAYNRKQFKSKTIKALMDNFQSELLRVISYCSAVEEREFTPTDYTYKGLSIEIVDQLNRQYPIEDIYTLSPMQEGMFFHALYDDASVSYFEQTSYRLHGELDMELVEKSLNELIKRHDILRTAFVYDAADRPLQVVLKERSIDFYYRDMKEMAGVEDKEAFLEKFKENDKKRFFDLANDVLMRISVLQVNPSEYEIIWSFHHILMDGWCVGILNKEFFEIYNSFLANRPFQLPPVKPYRTYIQWLEKQDMETSKTYWKEYLDAYEEVAALPKMNLRGNEEREYKNESVLFMLEREKTRHLNQIAGKNHVTMNIITWAVWGIILGKYNGKNDVVFGAVVSGRPFELEGVESMIGLFINTIPVRIRFGDKTKFNELLHRIQEEAITSEPYHYHLLADIQAEHILKQNLIDHILVFENYPIAEQIEGYEDDRSKSESNNGVALRLSNVDVFEQTNYDFNAVIVAEDQLVIRFDYNANVYNRNFVERVTNHVERLLNQVIDNEALEIGELTLLSGEEKSQVLVDFNDTQAAYPRDKTIHRLFEEQAAKTPDSIALMGMVQAAGSMEYEWPRELSLTYRQLNRDANQLAHLLKARGVAAGSIVCIMLPPSLEIPLTILAVLKAGGGYLPLALQFPEKRVNYILEDSESNHVITRGDLANKIAVNHREIDIIDIEDPGIYKEAYTNPENINHPTDIVYAIYTSGTTGNSKGVLLLHENLVNYVSWFTRAAHLTAQDRAMLTSSFAYDLGYTSLYPSLLNGGECHIIPRDLYLSPEDLVDYIEKKRISYLKVTPSLFKPIANSTGFSYGKCRSLRLVVVGGEPIDLDDIEMAHDTCEHTEFMNHYGPTEATIGCIARYIDFHRFDEYKINPTIGCPIANSAAYILDNQLQPVPTGVPAELCIAGASLALGYLNRPDLTIDKFPEGRGKPGELTPLVSRIYRTGDQGRWMPDGAIEFLGRIDNQVKVRGYRVELGEIESRLLSHDAVEEAAVILKSSENNDRYLCAYIVSHQALPVPELRDYLLENLPEYMLPSYFVFLEQMPLTPNGKVDRKALPEAETAETGDKYIAPRNDAEEKLVEIWSKVLGIGKNTISVDSNFFELGGHSLKAIRLVSMIHKELDLRMPIAEIFRTPKIMDLALYMKGAEEEKFISIETAEEMEYYSLSSAQNRLFLIQQMDREGTAYNVTDIFVSGKEPDKTKLEETFRKLIRRHEALRTSFQVVDGEPQQKVHDTVTFEIEYYDKKAVEGNVKDSGGDRSPEVEAMVPGFIRPFDLAQAPLLRVGLINAGGERYFLMVNIHHIVSDGMSRGILMQDFIRLYTDAPLPELRIHYKDFSQWQKKLYESGEMKKQEAFWLNEFAGEITDVTIPSDYDRPEEQSFAGDGVQFEIGEEETDRLGAFANEEGATLFMMLLAIYNVLLSKLSGKQDIVVGTGTAGRRHSDLQYAIGMFVNTLALRNFPTPGKTFREFIREIKERTLLAFENQDYLFEDLVEKVVPKRDMSRNPLFDTAFVLQDIAGAGPGDAGGGQEIEDNPLELRPYGVESKTAIFDITFFCGGIGETLGFNVNYRTSLFKKETIEMFIGYFKEIVSIVIENRDIKLKDIRLSSDLGTVTSDLLQRDQGDFGF